ncbi:unnamed protein product [Candidula unifasciata]|uniref:Thiamine pyrophosphokinase n=1 Tax=Candidula unifasciata TaxID=100452 RepID=A0A8S3Z6M4_9EUPU|nr:unnamed protein product [Candidula unifasciata]
MSVLRPLSCLLPEGPKIALIILNRPVDVPLLKKLWKKSLFTAVTDGAVNQLEFSLGDQKEKYIPNIITGDFDSAEPALLDYYKNKAVNIIPTPDQDETDFTKCVRLVYDHIDQTATDHIVAIGAFGGRMDHCLANINTLYTALTLSKAPLYLFSDNSMACLLDKGEHTLHCDTGLEGDWVGLVPVGQPANHVTTTGLKYNLTNHRMAFGELISTSNSLADKTVKVTTDHPLLWIMGYNLPKEVALDKPLHIMG